MIFSRWRPDRGGYDYFDSPSTRFGLGDDLPIPQLKNTTELGVASTDIGRAMPSDAAFVGEGPTAHGMLSPMSTSGLQGVDFTSPTSKLVMAVLAGLGLGYLIGKKKI